MQTANAENLIILTFMLQGVNELSGKYFALKVWIWR